MTSITGLLKIKNKKCVFYYPGVSFAGRATPPQPRRSPTMEQAVQASGPVSPDRHGQSETGRSDDQKEGEGRPRSGSNQQRRRGMSGFSCPGSYMVN